MKQLLALLLICSSIFSSCSPSKDITTILPKSGTIEILAKGAFRMWRDSKHGSFTVTLANTSPSQSVELYKVNSDGNEKWITPSLLAKSSLKVRIPADGHLLMKNFNDNTFTVTYTIAE